MKKLIVVMIAGLFAVAGAFADDMKKEEKAEGKPALWKRGEREGFSGLELDSAQVDLAQ